MQVAGEAVKELPSWAGPDVIIAATMSKLDTIVAAASAEVPSFAPYFSWDIWRKDPCPV